MIYIRYFFPLILFLIFYLGAALYFTISGNSQGFYQFSPLKAIIPAVIVGLLQPFSKTKENIHSFIKGLRQLDILLMSGIFILSGIFCPLTNLIGGVDSLVQATIQVFPHQSLLIGLFLMSALVSTAIGTSMGVVALIVPIAVRLAEQGAIPLNIGVATVIGGAMFGDNLSFVSDTTIAAVVSQGADLKRKFQLNAKIAGCSGVLMCIVLLFYPTQPLKIPPLPVNFINLLPYTILLGLAFLGFSVFKVLLMGIITAFGIAIFYHHLPILSVLECMMQGAWDMHEIVLLSLIIGGLGQLLQDKGAMEYLLHKMHAYVGTQNQTKRAEGMIGLAVSLIDILLANNTIAIILTGRLANNLATHYHIPAHRSATLLGNFSCVFQGILPYGAQILLASKLSGVLALDLSAQVYYCFILGIITILYIYYKKN